MTTTGSVYSIGAFGTMIADRVRMDAYAAALEQAVRPGSIVIDIGAGTGVMTLLACKFGAARVYAIEPNPAVVLLEEAARVNGVADRVVVIRELSTRFTPDTPADVIVSDLRGVLPFWEGHIESVVDARERLLRPGGVLIPESDTLHVAVVAAAEKYDELTAPWLSGPHGLNLAAAAERVLNSWLKYRFGSEQLLSRAAPAGTLDYRSIAVSESRFQTDVQLHIVREGVGHGIGVWFDTSLLDGIGFSNAPGCPDAIYGRAFFPWLAPIPLRVGFTVTLRLEAWPLPGNYVWRWQTTVRDDHGTSVMSFDQSTFTGTPPDRTMLRRGSSDFVPPFTADVELDAFVLSKVDGVSSLAEIGALLYEAFPHRFREKAEAFDHVCRCCRRYAWTDLPICR